MNKTTHYQLNQWDPEDRIMRSDFNADNAATDEALYENAQAAAEARQTALDAVTAEETARKDAVSSEAETRASQDAAIRAELSTAVAEAKNEAASANAAVQSQLSTLTGQTRKTLLKECTIPEDTLQYDVDVSWIDWSEWNTVIIDAYKFVHPAGHGPGRGLLLCHEPGEPGLQRRDLHAADAGHGGPVLVRQLADDPVMAQVHQPHGGEAAPVQGLPGQPGDGFRLHPVAKSPGEHHIGARLPTGFVKPPQIWAQLRRQGHHPVRVPVRSQQPCRVMSPPARWPCFTVKRAS